MKKILLASVAFFSISHQAYAWDWLNRQIDALPEMPKMSSLSKIYGMDKKTSPSDMVVKEEKPAVPAPVNPDIPAVTAPVSEDVPVISNTLPPASAPAAPVAAVKPAQPYYRPADKTLSGEERIVLQDDTAVPTASASAPAPAPGNKDDDVVIRSSDVMNEKAPADDVVISSSEKGPLPPPAVISVVKGNKDSAAKEKTQVNQAADKPSAAVAEQNSPAMPAPVAAEKAENMIPSVLPAEENIVAAANIFATFGHCRGNKCRLNKEVSMTRDEWMLVTRAFNIVPISTADQERTAIAIYIGEMEKLIGAKTGTSGDKAGTMKGADDEGQLDSLDEAKNTSVYLKFLNNLKFYDIGEIAGRGFYTSAGGWPHQTATIVEKETGKVYAVDSSFEENGKMAHIVTLDEWKTGWSPDGIIEEQAVTSDMIAPVVPKVRAVK